MTEEWKPIVHPILCNHFAVSTEGRLKRIDGRGNVPFLKPSSNGFGYLFFSLLVDGVKWLPLAHRLVAQAFLPNPANLPQVHHKDFDKANNRVDNLQWVTASDNQLFSMPVCPKRRGALHYLSPLAVEDVLEIRRRRSAGDTTVALGRSYGISSSAISNIVNRKTWKHI